MEPEASAVISEFFRKMELLLNFWLFKQVERYFCHKWFSLHLDTLIKFTNQLLPAGFGFNITYCKAFKVYWGAAAPERVGEG